MECKSDCDTYHLRRPNSSTNARISESSSAVQGILLSFLLLTQPKNIISSAQSRRRILQENIAQIGSQEHGLGLTVSS